MFTLPIIATGAPLTVSASMSGTVTDGDLNGVVGISPLGLETTLQQSFVSPDGGVTLFNAGVDVGPGIASIPLVGGFLVPLDRLADILRDTLTLLIAKP